MNCDMIILDYQNRYPIYQQVIAQIERYISLGLLKEGDSLPSIRELANHLGINPNTVKKAYDELESKGFIVSVSTKGCFVSHEISKVRENRVSQEFEKIKESMEELIQIGYDKNHLSEKLTAMIESL